MGSLFLNNMAQKLEVEQEIPTVPETKKDGPAIKEIVG